MSIRGQKGQVILRKSSEEKSNFSVGFSAAQEHIAALMVLAVVLTLGPYEMIDIDGTPREAFEAARNLQYVAKKEAEGWNY